MAYFISFVLILFSALFSGLTLGLMGLDVQTLKRKLDLGDKEAEKIYVVRKRGNLLLTTLLLGNVAVNSVLSIFLGSVASGVVAGLIATGLIFIFGEIIPQAVISRYAMTFGAKTAWIVRILIIIFIPITWPIAWILDKLLGEELPTVFSRGELIKVIEEHENTSDSDLDEDEERIVKGALTFSNVKVSDVMTPESVVVQLGIKDKLTPKLLKSLRESGHSRFPVHKDDTDDVVGMLFLRDLVGKTSKGKKVSDVYDKKVYFVNIDDPLDDVLNAFLKTKHHLFVAVDDFGAVEGIITVEDVLEEIVGAEIIDEFDKHEDLRKIAADQAKAKQTYAIKSKKRK